jgi:hypothetical protein
MMGMHGKIVTANRLTDGEVVYLAPGGNWSNSLSDARLLSDGSDQERHFRLAEQDVTRRLVVGPYLMNVVHDRAGIRPLSQREHIRATGPSVRAVFS